MSATWQRDARWSSRLSYARNGERLLLHWPNSWAWPELWNPGRPERERDPPLRSGLGPQRIPLLGRQPESRGQRHRASADRPEKRAAPDRIVDTPIAGRADLRQPTNSEVMVIVGPDPILMPETAEDGVYLGSLRL